MLFRKKSLKIRSWCLTWSTPPFIRYFRRVFFHPPSVSSERFLLRTAPFLDHFASFLVLQIVDTLLNTLAYTNQYLSTPWERGEGGMKRGGGVMVDRGGRGLLFRVWDLAYNSHVEKTLKTEQQTSARDLTRRWAVGPASLVDFVDMF